MAAPTASVVDDFNRASLGSNWSTMAAAGQPLSITASTVLGNAGGGYSGSYYNAQDESRPCEVGFDLPADLASSSHYFGFSLLDTPGSTASNDDGYKIGSTLFSGGEADALVLYRVDNGGDTELDRYEPANINNVSQIWLQVDATHVRMWVNEGSGLTEVAQAADTTYSGPWFPVVDMFSTEPQLDNLRFGAIVAEGGPSQRFRWRD